MEKVSLQFPLLQFDSTYASSQAAKQVIDLWSDTFRPTGFKPFPDELKVVEFGIFRQHPWWIPSGYYGDAPYAVDPGGYFTKVADYPTQEDALPFNLKPLATAFIEPGAPREVWRRHDPPLIIRKGDLIISAPQNNDIGPGQNFVFVSTLGLESATGDFELEPGVVWMGPINDAIEGGGAVCTRMSIPAVATGGDEVWLHLKAGGYGCTYRSVGVGIQASGPNMVAAPVPALLNGQPVANLTLPPHGSAWVKAPLAVAPEQTLLVNVTFEGSRGFKRTAPVGSDCWWSYDHDSHDSAAMGGTIGFLARRSHGFDCVKIL